MVANRDEFFKRPTIPMHFWEKSPHILAGKDLERGGTWLGLDKKGRFTALTNYRDGFRQEENVPSRGLLTAQFLINDQSAKDYSTELEGFKQDYNGFNLLVLDETGFFYSSNYCAENQELQKGVYALSNSILNDFLWQKTRKAQAKLSEIIKKSDLTTDELMRLMFDTERAPDAKLPKTGIPYEWEKGLSSMFIAHFPEYGTRSTTAILRDYSGKTTVQERAFDVQQNIIWDVTYFL